MIGIGITTHNRYDVFRKTHEEIVKHSPGCKIIVVDDASDIPVPEATFRFETNAGIAKAKNKCLELLDDCEHIFLFDDDCYPIVTEWYLPYIKSGQPHLSFTFSHLSNGRQNGNRMIVAKNGLVEYANPCGCMVYINRKCLRTVGGYDDRYEKWGFEHADYSTRVHNAGLTKKRFLDVPNSLDLFYSLDYYSETSSSVHPSIRAGVIPKNRARYQAAKRSKEFRPYKEKVFEESVVLAAYYNYTRNPQGGGVWPGDDKALSALRESCKKQGVKLVIFSNCLEGEDIVHSAPGHFVPNVRRWFAYREWLEKNPHKKIFMVDSTDVECLRNPFPEMKEGVIYCGDECDMKVDNYWMRKHQQQHVGATDYRKVISENAKKTLINCGLVGGDYETVTKFLRFLCTCHQRYTKTKINSTDMAMFNYVMWKYFKDIIVTGNFINTKFKYYEYNETSWFKHK